MKTPTNVYPASRKANQITMNWSGQSEYRYQISIVGLGEPVDPINGVGDGKATTFTTYFSLRASTWYQFRVRAWKPYSNGTAYSAWSPIYYVNTTYGDREITGTMNETTGSVTFKMENGDGFTMGEDDALVPSRYITEYDEHGDPICYADCLYVDYFRVPDVSKYGDWGNVFIETGDNINLSINGDEVSGTVKSIYLRPVCEDDYGLSGSKMLIIVFTDHTSYEYDW